MQNVTVHGRRRAERGDLVFGHLFEEFARYKHLHIVGENGGPCKPLPVNLAPERLGPAGLGDGQVASTVYHVLPVLGCNDMPERVGERVCDHLGVRTRSAREVHDHDIVVVRRGFAFGARELGGEDFVVVVEADPVLAGGLAHGHEFLDGGALRLGFFHLFLEAGLVVAYDHLDFGRVESVFQVFGGEHVRCRDGDGSDAVQCEQEKPELVTAAEDKHHAVALLDSLFL